MKIYHYSETTKEFLNSTEAEANPEETKIQGRFVPFIPAYSTLKPVPEININEAAIFEEEDWVVKPDYRKGFKKVDSELRLTDITEIGALESGYYLVDEETAKEIESTPDYYKIELGKVVKKTEEEYAQEQAQKRQEKFEKEFFLTSLGYIRRSVNMATGETKDFICDIVPALQAGLAAGIATPIITYELPDFTKEITTEYLETLQEVKPVTAEFLQECIMQLATDFMPQGLSTTEESSAAEEPAESNQEVNEDEETE